MTFILLVYMQKQGLKATLSLCYSSMMNYEPLAEKARYFKNKDRGAAHMCAILEEMKNETAIKNSKQIAVKLLKMGKITLDDIANATDLSIEEVQRLSKSLAKNKGR